MSAPERRGEASRLALRSVALGLVLLLAVACGSDAPQQEGEETEGQGAGEDVAAEDDIFMYQGDDRQERLEAGAAEEGGLTWYTTMTGEAVQNIATAFQQIYPDVEVEIFRTDGSDLITRIVQENAAGRLEGDVYEIGGELLIGDMDLYQPFYTPAAEAIPEDWKKMEGDGLLEATVRAAFISFGYNRDVLDPALVPETIEDVWTTPELAAEMVVTNTGTTVDWLGLMYQTFGEEEGKQIIEDLASNGMTLNPVSGSALGVMIARGEIAASPSVNFHDYVEQSAAGLPIEWIPLSPVKATPGNAGIFKGTDSPHAAILFMDFLLGDEGRAVLDQSGYLAPYSDLPFSEDAEIKDVLEPMETALDYQEAYNVWLEDLEAAMN